MHNPVATLALLACLTAAALPGQRERAVPGHFSGTMVNASWQLAPLSRTGGLFQFWYHGDGFPRPWPIVALGFRRSANGASERIQDVEVLMANTAVTFSTMSGAFATNLGAGAFPFFGRRPVRLPALLPQWDPEAALLWLPPDAPFALIGPHWLVQLDLGPAAGARSVDFRLHDAMLPRAFFPLASELPCTPIRLSAWDMAPNLRFRILTQEAGTSAALLLGTAHRLAPLPIHLDALGMTGCVLGLLPEHVVAMPATGPGVFVLDVPLPAAASTTVVHAQGLFTTARLPAGAATTDVVTLGFGTGGLVNTIANLDRDGPTAQYGPSQLHNDGPILLIRP